MIRRGVGRLAAALAELFVPGFDGGRDSADRATGASAPGADGTTGAEDRRDERWAERIRRPGLPNLHRVSGNLYRGAQPTAEGMRELRKMGVRTVVNLRSFHSDRDEIGDTGLGSEHIFVKAWHPEDEEIVRFLRIVTDPEQTPVFVHCMHGADRTGILCAVYRAALDGWSKEEALREMMGGGFGYHRLWVNLPSYFRSLDIDGLKRRAARGE